MENFIVSARKYRPATFDTVVGQLPITTTLKNAIKNNHLAQAFLFCGPRGVGKTTCARILAKTINCEKITPTAEACDQCESCRSFNTSHSLNIYELDAASNNSVDDIRSLVEQVRIAPATGKYKVYIIDEVHMLSSSAFNAFLKTLEEPPPYAIFILATTEKHKIIPTILSRCQVFNFNRIQVEDIASHLAFIAQKEHIQAEHDALYVIAQKADGALRDALSMFDQIVSYAGSTLTYKSVIDNLNILDYDYYFRIIDTILKGDYSAALLIFNEILSLGFDGHNFVTGLSSHLRDLLVSKDSITLSLLEVSAGVREKYKIQSGSCTPPFIFSALDITNACDVQYKTAKNQRLHVELALLRLCALANPQTVSTGDVKKKSEPEQPLNLPGGRSNSPSLPTSPKAIAPPPIPPVISLASPLKNTTVTAEQKTNPGSEKQTPPSPTLPNRSFTDEMLQEVWKKYADRMNEEGKMTLYSTLTKRKPVLKENGCIELAIENKVQEEELAIARMELLSFLRENLGNSSIQLQAVLIKEEQRNEVPYTSRDKFKRMAEKNPVINDLRKKLDLDIEY